MQFMRNICEHMSIVSVGAGTVGSQDEDNVE